MDTGSKQWLDLNLTWLKFKGPLHIMRYENLKRNFLSEVVALVRYLGFPVFHTRIACALSDRYEKYHRKMSKFQSISLFSREQREKLDKYISIVEREIQRREKSEYV